MSRQIGGIDVKFRDLNSNFHRWWVDYSPSVRMLPKGWKRGEGYRPLPKDLIWEKDVDIPLRDGIKLRADVFRPRETEDRPLPALLPWSPYGKTGIGVMSTPDFDIGIPKDTLNGLEKFEAPDPAEWCPRGYIVVQPDVRGGYESEGDMFWFGTQEGRDGHGTVEWIAEQPWRNGAVALVGNSWLAISQWFIAAEQPPHLKAIAPWEGMGDFYRESLCRGGIPNPAFWHLLGQDLNGRNQIEDVIEMVKQYPIMNDYWEDISPQLSKITVPMYVLASYSSNLHTEGSIRGFKCSNSKEKWLRLHSTQEWHDLYQPEANDDLQRFLDHYFLGKNNGWEFTPTVRLSLLRYNAPPIKERAEDAYPPTRTSYRTLNLDASNGTLAEDIPEHENISSYQSDTWDDDGAHFQYTFDSYIELCGSSKAPLYMSCNDLDDMDVYVGIRKLDREGRPLISSNVPLRDLGVSSIESVPDIGLKKYVGPNGRLRASKRLTAPDHQLDAAQQAIQEPIELYYPHTASQKVPRGQIVKLEIAIWPGGIVFNKGESIRFEVKGHESSFTVLPPEQRRLTPNQNIGKHYIYTGKKFTRFVNFAFTSIDS